METNKEEGEAPAQMADYTRVAVSGSGGRRNRGAEMYIHKEYHHQATTKYAAPQGNALLVEIQATRTSYSVLLAHAPHVTGGVRRRLPGVVGPCSPGGVGEGGPQVSAGARGREFGSPD